MWQIMWMLSLLPDWVFHLITIGGVLALLAAWVLKFVPFINTYRLPLQVGGALALLFGIWMEGGIVNEAKWQARVKELEEKVAVAEQQARDANEELDKKSKEKVKVIRGKTEYITRYIEKEIVKYDVKFGPGGQCEIPKEVIDSINSAAEAPKK